MNDDGIVESSIVSKTVIIVNKPCKALREAQASFNFNCTEESMLVRKSNSYKFEIVFERDYILFKSSILLLRYF